MLHENLNAAHHLRSSLIRTAFSHRSAWSGRHRFASERGGAILGQSASYGAQDGAPRSALMRGAARRTGTAAPTRRRWVGARSSGTCPTRRPSSSIREFPPPGVSHSRECEFPPQVRFPHREGHQGTPLARLRADACTRGRRRCRAGGRPHRSRGALGPPSPQRPLGPSRLRRRVQDRPVRRERDVGCEHRAVAGDRMAAAGTVGPASEQYASAYLAARLREAWLFIWRVSVSVSCLSVCRRLRPCLSVSLSIPRCVSSSGPELRACSTGAPGDRQHSLPSQPQLHHYQRSVQYQRRKWWHECYAFYHSAICADSRVVKGIAFMSSKLWSGGPGFDTALAKILA